jgi:surfactin family lipopeptide synthetase A
LFQVVISLAPPMPDLVPGWDQTPMDVESGGSKWDLYIELSDRPKGIMGRAQYNPDLFEEDAVAQTVEHFQGVLESVNANPKQRLSEVRIPSDQRMQTLAGGEG